MFENMQGALNELFTWSSALGLLIGVVGGMIIGALPGLSATMGIALLIPVTYGMRPSAAILMLAAIYTSAVYGGSISAILIHTPGTPSSAATCLDGYPMAQKGESLHAIGISTTSSVIGGVISAIALLLIAPPLARLSLKFGSTEYFLIAVFGLTLIASLAADNMVKGLLAGFFGPTVGLIGLAADGSSRYTFGITGLLGGINLIPAMIGLFSISQVMIQADERGKAPEKKEVAKIAGRFLPTGREFVRLIPLILECSVVGVFIGILPGAGGDIASWVGLNLAKNQSKHPELFGTGIVEGVAAPESANNAVTGGALIPLLTLGIPGDGVTALLLGAFMLHGITPGPTMFTKQGVMAYTIIIGCLIANIFLFPIGKALTRAVAKVIQVRYTYLACAIIMFCFAGAFAASGHVKELILTAGILILSYVLTILDIDNTPLLLGMILEPIMEKYFVSASMAYDRDYTIFVRRPISLIILIITVVMVISMMRVNRRVNALNAQQEAAMAAAHEEAGSMEDEARAVDTVKTDTEASFEDAVADAVFEQEHVKADPEVKVNLDKKDD